MSGFLNLDGTPIPEASTSTSVDLPTLRRYRQYSKAMAEYHYQVSKPPLPFLFRNQRDKDNLHLGWLFRDYHLAFHQCNPVTQCDKVIRGFHDLVDCARKVTSGEDGLRPASGDGQECMKTFNYNNYPD